MIWVNVIVHMVWADIKSHLKVIAFKGYLDNLGKLLNSTLRLWYIMYQYTAWLSQSMSHVFFSSVFVFILQRVPPFPECDWKLINDYENHIYHPLRIEKKSVWTLVMTDCVMAPLLNFMLFMVYAFNAVGDFGSIMHSFIIIKTYWSPEVCHHVSICA